MATQPCPCGWRTHPEKTCTCSPVMIDRYLSKISGPLLDRIDIHLEVASVEYKDLTSSRTGEVSELIRNRVENARNIQLERFGHNTFDNALTDTHKYRLSNQNIRFCNAQMTTQELQKYCTLEKDSHLLLEHAMKKLDLSARAYHRILKVARTIADLEGSERIQSCHLAEAIQYRALDRAQWTRTSI